MPYKHSSIKYGLPHKEYPVEEVKEETLRPEHLSQQDLLNKRH